MTLILIDWSLVLACETLGGDVAELIVCLSIDGFDIFRGVVALTVSC